MQGKKQSIPLEIPKEHEKKSYFQLFKEGNKYYKAKDYEKAVKFYRYVTIKSPSHIYIYFKLAAALSMLGKKEEAVQALLKATELNAKYVSENIDIPDIKSIRMDPRILSLVPLSKGTPDNKDPRICRYAKGPDDTAQIEITLKPDHTVAGKGSRTGASLNLQFFSGKWEENGNVIKVTLIFKGKSFGEEGPKDVSEEKTILIDREKLLQNKKDCFEIDSF